MKPFLILFALFFYEGLFSQQQISGKVTDENNFLLSSVLIVNITKNKQTYTNSSGEFVLEVSQNDQIRFIKDAYERLSVRVVLDGNIGNQHIVMNKIPQMIEEVKIIKLTGDLSKDSKKLSKEDKVWQLQNAIGLPKPPEIMREKAPELKDAFVVGFPVAAINIDALYKVLSGDSRRMKNLYKFDDRERNIKWLRDRIDDDYFTEAGIPTDRINEFLEFAMLEDIQIAQNIKKKNINAAIFQLDKTISKFVRRLKLAQ